ncbi:aconitate hydratase AcnA [Candidimonas humi]|uniref:Aconitate hydratase n=1 Tax=Candidimonas humi TaxID=683355 RepID=A0ABV8P4E1_9BURK|nr:aconitate hydratase AcnA [Candidimonas humi]MBV6307217.1 aconitate hydratase AcnA [Candidimonas humi]
MNSEHAPTDARRELAVGDQSYQFYSLPALQQAGRVDLARLPYCLRVLAENVLRNIGRNDVANTDLQRLLAWRADAPDTIEVPFHPARVLMQDYTGIPTLADLAALRDGMAALGRKPDRISPQIPVDLVIDHSLIVDQAGHAGALAYNLQREFERNAERYKLAKWATQALPGLRVVPPGSGILHQINIEHIAKVVRVEERDGVQVAFPDTMVGTDSHSTMVNGIGVLGWGVGGIEAEAAMLGLPVVVPLRRVVGVRLQGALRAGVTATDLVLTLTERLRAFKVVDSLVEFHGPALDRLAVTDRVTIANMAPEYGSTCAFFPVDAATLSYLATTGREAQQIDLVRAYAQAQGLWRDAGTPAPEYSAVLEFDLDDVRPCVAGPRRPQDRVDLGAVPDNFKQSFGKQARPASGPRLEDGAVVLAAITSCTNTSNPSVMLAAGLLARKARERGLRAQPWVKTSLTPGSQVVAAYLQASGLQSDLDALGFQVAGFGCASCGGNSGRLDPDIERQIGEGELVASAVLSGNRNFEARVHPLARANYLMSPPLVVAYALAGSVALDLEHEPLGTDQAGRPVYLRDIWPDDAEIQALAASLIDADMFLSRYAGLFQGSEQWQRLEAASCAQFPWDPDSTYIRRPPYLDDYRPDPVPPADIAGARLLLMLGDSTTTDHISPVGDIAQDAPAGRFLRERGVQPRDFNAYGSRRSNHEIMVRGTFANIRLRNELVPGVEGGMTRHLPDGPVLSVFDAAERYAGQGVPLLVVAGKEYGTGSSRDWAAKGTLLLGVRAVIAESFERIHRSNLIMMGVLPLQFAAGTTRATLGLDGSETFDIEGLAEQVAPGSTVRLQIRRANGKTENVDLQCRIDTANELQVWASGGMMPFVLRRLAQDAPVAAAR